MAGDVFFGQCQRNVATSFALGTGDQLAYLAWPFDSAYRDESRAPSG